VQYHLLQYNYFYYRLVLNCSTQNISFSDSSDVIKPPQPSSAIYGAPPFIQGTFWSLKNGVSAYVAEGSVNVKFR